MILYFAGNFPQLSDIKKEKEFKERLPEYNRLISFYYLNECETVLKLVKEKEEYFAEEIIEPEFKKTKQKGFKI